MKMTPVFFFLFYILSAAGTVRGARVEAEDCRRGPTVIGEFHENPCPAPRDPFPRLEASPGVLISEPWTKEKLHAYLASYCSVAMPEVRQCFADIIVECDPSYQRYLNALAANTSVTCRPHSTDLNPWLEFLLSRLTEEEVGGAWECSSSNTWSFPTCLRQARVAVGLDDPAKVDALFSTPTEDLVPLLNTFYQNYTVCKVSAIRDAPDRCSTWRMRALLEMIYLRGVPILGVQAPFTPAQVAALFELPYENRRSAFPFNMVK